MTSLTPVMIMAMLNQKRNEVIGNLAGKYGFAQDEALVYLEPDASLEKSSLEKSSLEKSSLEKSRGKNSFASGKKYQTQICETLNKLIINEVKCAAVEVDGAKAGADVTLISHMNIGLETKNKGAFEGGCKKMTYNTLQNRLEILEKSIHKTILADSIIYEGLNLPWYEGKKTLEDWKKIKSVFSKDLYIDASDEAISEYYRESGVTYIQLEHTGLYHTGTDILNLGVPYFSCPGTRLRIRSTKHKKKGICTDITAALQYNKRKLVKSPYSLDIGGTLPHSMKVAL